MSGARRVSIIGTRGYPSYYGGFETAVRFIAPALCDAGWDVTVYGRTGSTRDDDPDLDPRVHRSVTWGIEKKSLSTLSYGMSSSIDAVRRKPEAALIMNVANGFWIPLLKARGIRTVVNVDGIEWERAKWGRAARMMFRAGAWFTIKFADLLVYDADAIAARWKNDFGTDGVVIPYGGTPVVDAPLPLDLSHRGYALVVARFVPENSIQEIFDAIRELGEDHDIVIVGSTGYGGDFDDQAAALASEYPRVRWLGHVSDDALLHALWVHAGVYVHGHSVGGTNPALVQAMACQAPTVARDTVYNREVLGDEGAFFQPDSAAIVEAVRSTLASEAEMTRLAEVSATRARERYTWEAVCAAYDRALTNTR